MKPLALLAFTLLAFASLALLVVPKDGSTSPGGTPAATPLATPSAEIDGEYPYPTANAAIDSDSDGFYTVPELKQAIRETYPFYVWPDAYHPTVEDIFFMLTLEQFPPNARLEVPMEISALGNINQCTWQQNWLDAFERDDEAEMTLSMQQLRSVVLTNPHRAGNVAHYTEMFNQADLGNAEPIRQDIKQNCYGFNKWIEGGGVHKE